MLLYVVSDDKWAVRSGACWCAAVICVCWCVLCMLIHGGVRVVGVSCACVSCAVNCCLFVCGVGLGVVVCMCWCAGTCYADTRV